MAKKDIQRSALLIGVPEYDIAGVNLPVVRNDLQILHSALESSRFEVQQLGIDPGDSATRNRIRARMHRFCAEAKPGTTLLLYFSGHGANHNNRDYLVPSDGTLDDLVSIEEYLVPVDLSDLFDQCNARTILFFIDACRSEVKTKDLAKYWTRWSEGELRAVKDREYAIVFSCGPGQVSRFDRGGRFSFFTRALADVLDAAHPAHEFGEVTEALQERLDALTGDSGRQTIRIRAEFDLRQQLMKREICDGPRPTQGKANQLDITDIREMHQCIPAGSFLQRPDHYHKQFDHVCVLFANLVGSTEFRLDHSQHEAIHKMVLHNSLASDVITDKGGVVVKHLGGQVMGVFGGSGCDEQAVSTGIAIIRRLEEENAGRGLHFPYDVHTSIGIRSGGVWRFRFDGCNIEDCVGDPVDIAKRLCSLAGLGQVICDEDTFQRIRFPHADWSYSDQVERFIEGLDEPLSVRLIVPSGRPTGPDLIRLCGFTRRIPEEVRSKLRSVYQLFREKRFDDALKLCREILGMDRGNFEAHVYCAEILLDRASAGNGDRFHALQEVIHEHLCVAKQIHPQASRVWRLLARAYYLQGVEVHNPSLLSIAHDRAVLALKCAEEHMDENGEVQARILLALILREQAKCDPSSRAANLARANEYCGQVASQNVGFLDRTRSDHLLVQALVQADCGAPPETVGRLLDQARDADPRNPQVHEALAKFCRSRG
jgi:class 3 adenylate cyclase